jgi:hypothetical protein
MFLMISSMYLHKLNYKIQVYTNFIMSTSKRAQLSSYQNYFLEEPILPIVPFPNLVVNLSKKAYFIHMPWTMNLIPT